MSAKGENGDLSSSPSFERGSPISHCVETSLWRRLRTCLKTGYGMDEWMNE
jgi:hypothetical protein